VKSVGPLVWLVLLFAVFYLLILRPQRQRQRAQQRLADTLEPGARVRTTSGLYGEVVGFEDDGSVLLEVAPGVTTRWSKPAISVVFPEPDADDEGDEDETDEPDTLDKADGAEAAPDADSTERPT
jgi:preprotein translocase subunit YajC